MLHRKDHGSFMSRLSSHITSGQNDKRSVHRVMNEINTVLGDIHKTLPTRINIDRYTLATQYVSQFIPYTSIWNIKFTYNFESPEVALMQILHLEYILSNESDVLFKKDKEILKEMTQLFMKYSPYSEKLFEVRKRRFLDYVHQESTFNNSI